MDIMGIFYGNDLVKSVEIIFEKLCESGINLRGSKVLIKPNLVAPLPYTTGATTDPKLTKEIIKNLKKQAVSKIYIAESSWVGANTEESFKVTGYMDLSSNEQIELIDIKKEPWLSKQINGEVCKSIALPRAVVEADYIINVPVLKCHSQTVLSMGMKNLKGLIPDFEKRKFHANGLHKCIVDLNTMIKPVLTILDCRLVDLNYEFGGNPIYLNILIWGNNTVTLDCLAASFFGYNPSEIEYLSIACSLGLGSIEYSFEKAYFLNFVDKKNIRQVKEFIQRKIDYERNRQLKKLSDRFDIIDQNACTGCRGAAYFALERIPKEIRSNFKIYIGKLSEDQPNQQNCFGIGNCLKGYFSEKSIVYGCPPSPSQIYTKLECWLKEDEKFG